MASAQSERARRCVRRDRESQGRRPFRGREFAEIGGLASYGTNLSDVYRRIGGYVDKILKGQKPGDLPIEQPTTFELVVNREAARELGVTIPLAVLQRADKVLP